MQFHFSKKHKKTNSNRNCNSNKKYNNNSDSSSNEEADWLQTQQTPQQKLVWTTRNMDGRYVPGKGEADKQSKVWPNDVSNKRLITQW